MREFLPYILIAVNLLTAYPSALWLLSKSSVERYMSLTAALTIGLSAGCLSQVMLWQSLLGIPFGVEMITATYLVLMLPGIVWWWKQSRHTPKQTTTGELWEANIPRLALVIICGVAAAIIFNAIYWPFYQSDALGIYAAQASYLKTSRALIPMRYANFSYYQAYPMLVQLNYAYLYLAAGWENGYVAKVIPTLLSIGSMAATYTLGTSLYGRKAGWLAAVLLALTPAFARWGSSGYVDLPMAFYYTLAALFGWRLWQSGGAGDALLMGTMMGLAAWTKNAGLVGIGIMGLWLAYLWLKGRINLHVALLTVIVCGLVAAPWYARNWLEAHLIIPDTAWTEQAGRTVNNLLIFITRSENFGITGWLVVGGLVGTLYNILKRWKQSQKEILLTLFVLPIFGLWWLLVSYDPRFLLLILPLATIPGAQFGLTLWERLKPTWQRLLRPIIMLVAVTLAVYNMWTGVEFKSELLRDPLMDDAAKQAIVLSQRGS